jgi:hypothetical protein
MVLAKPSGLLSAMQSAVALLAVLSEALLAVVLSVGFHH